VTQSQEYKVAFPLEYAGKVMGQLTVLGIEIKDTVVVEEICTIAVDLEKRLAWRFQKWLHTNTDGRGTLSPEISIEVR
jgi:hypothetical protein